jgi:biotin carboxyl carrier protein
MIVLFRDGDGREIPANPDEFTAEDLGGGRFRLSDGTKSWQVVADRAGATCWITIEGVGEARLERVEAGRRRSRERSEGTLSSPMPGKVVKVEVEVGESVASGQDLVVIEAMKMEIKISTPIPGTVRAVHVREGDPCDAGQILVEVAH